MGRIAQRKQTSTRRGIKVAPLPAAEPPGTASGDTQATIDAEERRRLIKAAAYDRAQKRGFGNGDPVHDWLEAEAEIDAALGLR